MKKYLDKKIVDDDTTKLLVFYAALFAFLKEPLNVFLRGASGIGKGYIVREALRCFPRHMIKFLSGMSPKAVFHRKGTLMDRNDEPIDFSKKPEKPLEKDFKDSKGKLDKEEYTRQMELYKLSKKVWDDRLKDSYTLVDWSHKIIVFLEEPSKETMDILRPFMSHDAERIEYQFTDRTSKGRLSTTNVVITGFPAFIFCTASSKFMKEIVTRCFTASPSQTKQKIKGAKKLITKKYLDPIYCEKPTKIQREMHELLADIEKEKDFKGKVFVPFPKLDGCFPGDIPRDMRDYEHFMQLCSAVTLVNRIVKLKDANDVYFVATLEDILETINVFDKIIETTRAGVGERLLDFYWDVIAKPERRLVRLDGDELVRGDWTMKELVDAYNERYPDIKSSGSIRYMMEQLEKAGFVNIDKAQKAYKFVPIRQPETRFNRLVLTLLQSKSSVLEKYCRKALDYYLKKYQILHKGKIVSDVKKLLSIVYNKSAFRRFESKASPQIFHETNNSSSSKVEIKQSEEVSAKR